MICFLEHADKSFNKFNCPVCKELVFKENLKSIKLIILQELKKNEIIDMKLFAKLKHTDIPYLIDM